MDNDKLIDGEAYLGNDRVKYQGHVTETEIVLVVDDKDPIISAGVYNGIEQREVNKAKGV